MSDVSARLDEATLMIRAQELHGEVLDPDTNDVWQSLEPITRDDFEALPLAAGWRHVGMGPGAMAECGFAQSPGRDEDGPMAQRAIGGRDFGFGMNHVNIIEIVSKGCP